MQSSTGQYSTQAGDPAQPVQHSVITASSFGFFLRGVVMPFERGSCFNSSGTIPGAFAASDPVAIELNYISGGGLCNPGKIIAFRGETAHDSPSLWQNGNPRCADYSRSWGSATWLYVSKNGFSRDPFA